MNNKKFLMVSIPIFLIIVIVTVYGTYDAYRDAEYEFCWGKDLNFARQNFNFGKEPVITCRNKEESFCFDSSTRELIDCK